MSRPVIRIHNTETNEVIDREMNDEEYTQWQLDVAADKARLAAEQEASDAKAALLAKLGITADEAKLLLSPTVEKLDNSTGGN
jgi:AmiR/NasT family two-component response regulator